MSQASHWQPTASFNQLQQRALLIQRLRQFFISRDILEVETPLLAPATIPDPNIESLKTSCAITTPPATLYLQTSPEFYMKRLLAAGSGPIFQICKAFRDGEQGRKHNPEFTLLEWYRPGYNHHDLMGEVSELLQMVLDIKIVTRISYGDLFFDALTINPHLATIAELIHLSHKNNLNVQGMNEEDKDSWLSLLLTHCIEPQLKGLTFIYDYPASQAALAKIRQDDYPVAERFEAYIDSMELANGFHELGDAVEQERRFLHDLQLREQAGLATVPLDQQLLAALDAGFPNCAGVAVGVDRLAMLALEKQTIADVMSFVTEVN